MCFQHHVPKSPRSYKGSRKKLECINGLNSGTYEGLIIMKMILLLLDIVRMQIRRLLKFYFQSNSFLKNCPSTCPVSDRIYIGMESWFNIQVYCNYMKSFPNRWEFNDIQSCKLQKSSFLSIICVVYLYQVTHLFQ